MKLLREVSYFGLFLEPSVRILNKNEKLKKVEKIAIKEY